MREWYAEPDSIADIDVEAFAYDAPFDRASDEPSEAAQVYEDSDVAPYYDDPYGYYEDDAYDDWGLEDDDDDLLEALEEALDEVEAEDALEALKERASPTRDVAELDPAPETVYRGAIDHFLGRPRPTAPRYSQIRARTLPATGGLELMLQDSLRRSREKIERWRIHGWAHDLPGAHLGARRATEDSTTTTH